MHRFKRTVIKEERILEEYDPESEDCRYLLECARRLDSVLHSVGWSVELGLALVSLLNACSVRFRDGFVVNEGPRMETLIGYAEAEAIVAAICSRPDEDAEWWRNVRLGPGRPDVPDELYEDLRVIVTSDASVESLG